MSQIEVRYFNGDRVGIWHLGFGACTLKPYFRDEVFKVRQVGEGGGGVLWGG